MKKLLRKGSFAISPADHIYCDFSRELHCLELNVSNTHLINLEVHKYINLANMIKDDISEPVEGLQEESISESASQAQFSVLRSL